MGSIWHSITLDMYTIPKQFSHTPTSMNSFVANKAKNSISKSSFLKEKKNANSNFLCHNKAPLTVEIWQIHILL